VNGASKVARRTIVLDANVLLDHDCTLDGFSYLYLRYLRWEAGDIEQFVFDVSKVLPTDYPCSVTELVH
jgi:hypothetical protein